MRSGRTYVVTGVSLMVIAVLIIWVVIILMPMPFSAFTIGMAFMFLIECITDIIVHYHKRSKSIKK